MNVLVINGSPKGKTSVTLQHTRYLEKCFPSDSFTVLHVGQKIRKYQKDFSEITAEIEKCDLVLFSYPVYTFICPSQLHKFIELCKENKVDFTKSRNVIIAALILVLSFGINYSSAGAISFNIGSVTISLSGLAVGALVGIILNAVLPEKDYDFDEEDPDGTGVNFEVGQSH